MKLEEAKKIADEVVAHLSPFCKRIEVAGSIRRKRPIVGDVDIVLIPSDLWNINREILALGPVKMSGMKIQRVESYKGIPIDIYFATDESWATLLLIRIGSKENNIRLCSLAKKRWWRLAANGDGLFNEKGERIAGDTEASIFEALGLAYQPPEAREIKKWW